MTNLETFRPKSGITMALFAFFAVSALVSINIMDYGFVNAMSSIAWGLVVCAIFYLIFIHPKVVFFDEGLMIINPLQSFTVGWHEIEEIDARYTMYIVHGPSREKIHAFAAQAPGRYHSRTVHPNEVKGMRVGDSGIIRAGESPRSSSGAATAIARTRFEQFQRFEGRGAIAYNSTMNFNGVSLFLALLVIAVIAQVMHG
jgi:hypothetical protein